MLSVKHNRQPQKEGVAETTPRVAGKAPTASASRRRSELGYPLPGAPVRGDVFDPPEADSGIATDKDHRSLHRVMGCIRRPIMRFRNCERSEASAPVRRPARKDGPFAYLVMSKSFSASIYPGCSGWIAHDDSKATTCQMRFGEARGKTSYPPISRRYFKSLMDIGLSVESPGLW